ncbi:hypothetical protein DITRI_Ditri16bG0093800 [Diplodiscus trichospermus]
MGIYDVDTRAITHGWRQDGSLIGVLSTEQSRSDQELLEMSRSWDITVKSLAMPLMSGLIEQSQSGTSTLMEDIKRHTELLPMILGSNINILRRLASYGCKITVVPSTWPAEETLKLKPDGVLFSNGPGDPSAVPYAV